MKGTCLYCSLGLIHSWQVCTNRYDGMRITYTAFSA